MVVSYWLVNQVLNKILAVSCCSLPIEAGVDPSCVLSSIAPQFDVHQTFADVKN